MDKVEPKIKEIDPNSDPFCLNLALISNTLLTLERNIFWLGIPLLPELGVKLDPPVEFFYPLGDFIRATLVTIPTKDLISARDILHNKSEDSYPAEYFLSSLRRLSLFDYLYFPLITFSSISIVTFISIAPFSLGLINALWICLTTAVGGTMGSFLFYLENIRFFSFIKILDSEILRRSGNIPNKNIKPLATRAFSRTSQS